MEGVFIYFANYFYDLLILRVRLTSVILRFQRLLIGFILTVRTIGSKNIR